MRASRGAVLNLDADDDDTTARLLEAPPDDAAEEGGDDDEREPRRAIVNLDGDDDVERRRSRDQLIQAVFDGLEPSGEAASPWRRQRRVPRAALLRALQASAALCAFGALGVCCQRFLGSQAQQRGLHGTDSGRGEAVQVKAAVDGGSSSSQGQLAWSFGPDYSTFGGVGASTTPAPALASSSTRSAASSGAASSGAWWEEHLQHMQDLAKPMPSVDDLPPQPQPQPQQPQPQPQPQPQQPPPQPQRQQPSPLPPWRQPAREAPDAEATSAAEAVFRSQEAREAAEDAYPTQPASDADRERDEGGGRLYVDSESDGGFYFVPPSQRGVPPPPRARSPVTAFNEGSASPVSTRMKEAQRAAAEAAALARAERRRPEGTTEVAYGVFVPRDVAGGDGEEEDRLPLAPVDPVAPVAPAAPAHEIATGRTGAGDHGGDHGGGAFHGGYSDADSAAILVRTRLPTATRTATTTTTAPATTTVATTTAPTTTAAMTSSRTPFLGRLKQLYCFSVTQAKGYEIELVQAQLERRAGIFSCGLFSVYSNKEVAIGRLDGRAIVSSGIGDLKCEYGGPYGTALNSEIFARAWQQVFKDGLHRRAMWTAKVDPDTVFLPERLSFVLGKADHSAPAYLNNCDEGLHGPIEIVSRVGMQVYDDNFDRCVDKLKHEWDWAGEDVFLRHCFRFLKVEKVDTFGLLAESHCFHTDPAKEGCWSGKVSFHPFKTVKTYFKCLEQAASRDEAPPDVGAAVGLAEAMDTLNKGEEATAHKDGHDDGKPSDDDDEDLGDGSPPWLREKQDG